MEDLTIVFLTLNKVPKKWAEFHKQILIEAIGDAPIITISKKQLDWGINLIQKQEGLSNVYWQILRGAKIATTPFIGIAEDDTLYPKEHFDSFRPKIDEFAYDMNRWGIFTWGRTTYFWKKRLANATLIAPRKLLIEALTERFNKYPNGLPERIAGELGFAKMERKLGVTVQKAVKFYARFPVVCFNHDFALDPLEKKHRKVMGHIKAFDIPKWGRAKDLVKKFI